MKCQLKQYPSLEALRKQVITCTLCPRLVEFRENVPSRKSFENETYWRKPVPGFGDPNAWLLITGLAPSAHGGNRTGRIFTGDKTSEFLFKALHAAGFANRPISISKDDDLVLKACYLTAAVKCVPPNNRPIPQEILNCNCYYQNELRLLKSLTHVLLLGRLAFDAFVLATQLRKRVKTPLRFAHGARYQVEGLPIIYSSYHPSPQNTNTGKMTEKMFLDLLHQMKDER